MTRSAPFASTALLLAACLSATDEGRDVTLLVTNGTCATGECVPIDVRGLIPKFTVPQPIGGLLLVGRVEGPSACLTFPREYTLKIISPTDTTIVTWTTGDAVILHAIRRDPFTPAGSTAGFVPASSDGWSVTFPSGSEAPGLAETAACSP